MSVKGGVKVVRSKDAAGPHPRGMPCDPRKRCQNATSCCDFNWCWSFHDSPPLERSMVRLRMGSKRIVKKQRDYKRMVPSDS